DRRPYSIGIKFPLIVVEVLSPSTEYDDRGAKFRAYKACPSIREILLISQYAQHVEVYSHDEEDQNTWYPMVYEPGRIYSRNKRDPNILDCRDGSGQDITFTRLDLQLTMDEIYEGIDFSQPLIEG
ncbi:MAG TPA: Uma2 family endonuclease, partial [Ktedonosporobacter sp.]|nr:Uma2 family endonuclease [Ktedonosporobacter sp.]